MHFDFAFGELDIVPLRDSVRSYVIRLVGMFPERDGQTAVLCEVSREAILQQLADVLSGQPSGDIAVFPANEANDEVLRLEQETFTDGQRGPDGYPRNLAGLALNYYRRNRDDGQWFKVAGQIISMEEAFHLLGSLRNDQITQACVAAQEIAPAQQLMMSQTRSSLAPIPGSDPTGPNPPFPAG